MNKLKVKDYTALFDKDQLKTDMKQKAISGGMITTVCQLILFLLGLASTIILARMLTPEHFGLIGMVTALTVLIQRFQDIGLGDAIIQKKEITHEQVSTLFWITLSICLLCTILVALSAKAVAWFYNDQRLTWITIAFASNFIFSGLSIQHFALIRRRMEFKQQTIIRVISAVFALTVGVTLAWLGYGYWALVWKELARSFLSTALAWMLCDWRPGLPVRNAGVRVMLKFGGNITGYNILFYLTNNLDSILIGKFFGAMPVGLYTRAKQLTAIPVSQLIEPMKNVSLPLLSALQNDPITYRNYYTKILEVLTFIYMPLIIYIGVYAHQLVYLALGSQWMDAVPIFRLFAIYLFIASPITAMYGMTMLSLGYVSRYFFWGFFTSLSTAIGFIVGIKWGVVGIVTSLLISTTVNHIFSMFYVYKDSPVMLVSIIRSVYKPIIASIIMGIFLILTYHYFTFHIALQLMLSILSGTGIYLAVWLFFPGGYNNIIEFASYPLSVLKRKKE